MSNVLVVNSQDEYTPLSASGNDGGGALKKGQEIVSWRSSRYLGLYYSSILVGIFKAATMPGPLMYAVFTKYVRACLCIRIARAVIFLASFPMKLFQIDAVCGFASVSVSVFLQLDRATLISSEQRHSDVHDILVL